jgi:hypothetical protein
MRYLVENYTSISTGASCVKRDREIIYYYYYLSHEFSCVMSPYLGTHHLLTSKQLVNEGSIMSKQYKQKGSRYLLCR